ncbi:hypothetical protein Tco_0452106 [Tanacetum coccineum]
MDLYHSRLTQDDLNDLIVKYKIPSDLHPRLPFEEFVMSELSDDAIGSISLSWKSGFFLIDQRAISDSMVWRYLNAAIDDPRPAGSSFSMADVHRLSARVIKLRDMPGVMCIHDFLSLPEWTGAEASTSGATSSHVVKCTRYALAQSSGSTTRPSLFVDNADDGSDDNDDACVKIPLVTPIRSAAVIPSSGNKGGSSAAPTAECPSTRDSWGKGIMANDAAAPSVGGVAGNCEFTREEWDALYQPTFGVLTKEVFKDLAIFKTVVDQFPTPRQMVLVKSLSDDQLTTKISVLVTRIKTPYQGVLVDQNKQDRLLLVSSERK